MKKLFILSCTIFLTSALFAQQTSTAAIKDDKMGKVLVSTKSANGLLTQIGTPHADVYDERIVFGGIKIDGPLASVWAPYKFYLGSAFSHCSVNFFQLAKTDDGWKIIHIGYTVRTDNCKN